MDAITKATNAAKSALYGDSSKPQSGIEPVSGQTGQGTADAPYDAGNSAGQSGTTGEAMGSSYESSTDQARISDGITDKLYGVASTLSGPTSLGTNPSNNTSSTQSGPRTGGTLDEASGPSYESMENRKQQSDIPSLSKAVFKQQGSQVDPYHDIDKSNGTSIRSTDIQAALGPSTSANESKADTRGQARRLVGGIGGVETAIGADSSSGTQPEQKLQGADRPGKEPSGEQVSALRDEKEKHVNIQAGNFSTRNDIREGSAENKDPRDNSGDHLGTVDHGALGQGKSQGGGAEGYSEEKGTGQLWVQSTGVAANGGDFDAARPGAGKEAERLLEQSGVHPTQPGGGAQDLTDAADPFDPANKPNLADKIKDKLHISHGS